MSTEIELKYLLLNDEANEQGNNLTNVISKLLSDNDINYTCQKKTLTNCYMDTNDLAFRKMDIGLRVRGIQDNGTQCRYEQTIKTSGQVIGGLHKRPEYNVDIENNQVDLSLFPDDVWPQNINVKELQSSVISLFNTHFTRTTWLINVQGAVIELAYDQGEISCDGFEESERINELELELQQGETHVLMDTAILLMSQVLMRSGLLSKAARGYRLAAKLSESGAQSNNDKLALKKGLLINENNHFESLEIIPMKEINTISAAFYHGIEFSLEKLQQQIDLYVERPSLKVLSKLNELFVLLRQGFWLFEQHLSPEAVKVRDELSYFIRATHWVDNAKHLKELTTKSGVYRKKIDHSEALIKKLKLARKRYPNIQQMLTLLMSERSNRLQLSLLNLILVKKIIITSEKEGQDSTLALRDFAQGGLSKALNELKAEVASLANGDTLTSQDYLAIYPLLIRSLLTGSWFISLYNSEGSRLLLSEKQKNYRLAWLDVKQGISELQTLYLLQQQLDILPVKQEKLASWLTAKVDNLLEAIEQSKENALSITPYWQG